MDNLTTWTIIFALGIGSFVIRFSFLGLIGNRPMPPWLLRHLRYAAVAILPGIAAPLVVWPSEGATGDPVRLASAAMTVVIGYFTKNVLAAIVAGGATFGVLELLF